MREIKFMAWHIERKQMCIRPFGIGEYPEFKCSDGVVRKYSTAPFHKKIMDIMQYTDLKDKNGKEIYSGNICKVHIFTQELGENMGVVEGEHEFVAEIKLDNISAGVMLENSKGDSGPVWAYGGMHEESFEIIGTVQENPELLES